MNYNDAGVNIDNGDELVNRIKKSLPNIGGFAGSYEIPSGYEKPVLISCTDGVGTKLKIARKLNNYKSIGQDLVAMCVNDLIVCGAKPLYFLDYLACGQLNIDEAEIIINSIIDACKIANIELLGGETAEMPGMYENGEYDLAGFATGIVEKDKIIDGSNIKKGNIIIGIESSGLHANGFSLVRKIIKDKDISLDSLVNDIKLSNYLLTPTTIYVDLVLNLIDIFEILGISNITGGGISGNVNRIIPKGLYGSIRYNDIMFPPIFKFFQEMGMVHTNEMIKTFNCGIGMVLIVKIEDVEDIMTVITEHGYNCAEIGKVI